MSEDQEVNALAYTARLVEDYLNSLTVRETLLARLLTEHKAALEAVQSMPDDREAECMLPIGGGVSVPVKVDSSSSYLVSLGAGVYMKKTKEDTVYFLNKKVEDLEKALRETIEQKRRAEEELARIQERLQQALQSRQQ